MNIKNFMIILFFGLSINSYNISFITKFYNFCYYLKSIKEKLFYPVVLNNNSNVYNQISKLNYELNNQNNNNFFNINRYFDFQNLNKLKLKYDLNKNVNPDLLIDKDQELIDLYKKNRIDPFQNPQNVRFTP